MLLYQTLAFTIHGKKLKSDTKTTNAKYQLRHGMKSLNYLLVVQFCIQIIFCIRYVFL